MMIEKFIEELVRSIEADGKGLEVIPTEKEGTNGVIQHGLIFKQNDSKVAPVLYVDEIFMRYSAGELSMGNATEHLIRKYEELPEPCIPDIDAMMSAPDIINKITLRLVNGPENEGMIERRRLVYHEIENTDLVCIFYVTILMEETLLGSIAVSKELLERYLPDIADGNELYDEVVKRVVAEDIYMESIVSVVERMLLRGEVKTPPLPLNEDIMYVLSNRRMTYGASMILTGAARNLILEKFPDGKVTVIPSSVHETLLLHTKENEDIKSLRDMVKQVNSTEVPDEDVLSDNVYHYNANTGSLEIAY